jgi:hypothetical protein
MSCWLMAKPQLKPVIAWTCRPAPSWLNLSLGSRPLGRMLEADDDIAVFLPGLHVPVGRDDLVQT